MDMEKVRVIIAELLAIPADNVKNSSNLINDLGADSLDLVELTMSLESEFGIEIDDDALGKWVSVEDVMNIVAARL
jgi:acyl carrier protein